MSTVQLFLDDTPGETRGVLVRDGRCERLVIRRDDDPPQHRLGARCVGRVVEVRRGYGAAFVDLGVGGAPGFLPLAGRQAPREGDSVEVEVVAEPRERKGPSLRLIGAGEGAPRLLAPGPDVATLLRGWAPEAVIVTGAPAIEASLEAEEEALTSHAVFPSGLDLCVERTRALIAVDIDHAAPPGAEGRRGRDRANQDGLRQAARLIRLKSWGGLIVVDLAGARLAPDAVLAAARDAFAADRAVLGPLSRFGLLQLTVPWARTPVEDVLLDAEGRPTVTTRAIDVVRRLRLALLRDTASPRLTAICAPAVAAIAEPLLLSLGPRAAVRADAAGGRVDIVEA